MSERIYILRRPCSAWRCQHQLIYQYLQDFYPDHDHCDHHTMMMDLLQVVLNPLVRVGLILPTMVGIMLGSYYHHGWNQVG